MVVHDIFSFFAVCSIAMSRPFLVCQVDRVLKPFPDAIVPASGTLTDMANIHPNDLSAFTASVVIDSASAVMVRAVKLVVHHGEIVPTVCHSDHP